MKKILILGASGMAGHVVYNYLNEHLDKTLFELYGTTNSNNFGDITTKINIFDTSSLSNYLDMIKPDFVINCVGMLIRGSKEYPDKTIFANSYFPHFLARLSYEKSFKLIHISTDCVFSGKKGGYIETSVKDATDVYGMSKALGEIIDDKNLTIRTSIIGPEIKKNGEGLFHWFMTNEDKNINGYKSNIWSGVTTLELAKFIKWVLENKDIKGLLHLTNNHPISKFDLLTIFNKTFLKDKKIISDKDYKCDKSFVNTNKDVDYVVPSYETMLLEQKEFMMKNALIYATYKL